MLEQRLTEVESPLHIMSSSNSYIHIARFDLHMKQHKQRSVLVHVSFDLSFFVIHIDMYT